MRDAVRESLREAMLGVVDAEGFDYEDFVPRGCSEMLFASVSRCLRSEVRIYTFRPSIRPDGRGLRCDATSLSESVAEK